MNITVWIVSGLLVRFLATHQFAAQTEVVPCCAISCEIIRKNCGYKQLRNIVVGNDGNLYGATRIGGQNTCTFTSNGCGVANAE